jgi:7-carboxy-7-deazaguanine synthase
VNQQAIEKSTSHPEGLLDVHSIFYTIQGEGPFSGFPAVFIRLAGCNLQCPHCDTEYTQGRRLAYPEVVAEYVSTLSQPRGLVVITGGEPFRQNLTKLLQCLSDYRLLVQIESNGTLPPSKFQYTQYPRPNYLAGTSRFRPHGQSSACSPSCVLG